jgi:hypothetical protein
VFDGSYLYASVNTNVDQIDPATGQWTGVTIPGPLNPNRGLAYDPATDHFWTANFDSLLYEFDRSGTIINTYQNSNAIYGLAWDMVSPDGPWLWVFSQEGNPAVQISQFDPYQGVYTDVTYQGASHNPGVDCAGGAGFIEDWQGAGVFIGLVQSDIDFFFGMEIDSSGGPIPNLLCIGDLFWSQVESGSTVKGSFTVSNIGHSHSLLNWTIADFPDWGSWTFTPSSGYNLTPENSPFTVEVEVVAPELQYEELFGEVEIINMDDPDDYCKIEVYMTDGFTDGFEEHTDFVIEFTPWAVLDVDKQATWGANDYDWPHEYEPQAFIIMNPLETNPPWTGEPDSSPHTGKKYASCFASYPEHNDDWLISPPLTMGLYGELSFWARSGTDYYGLEKFEVGISTTDTNPSNFTIVSSGPYLEAPVEWTEYTYDLSLYEGSDIYIGIHCISQDAFFFSVDDFHVDGGSYDFLSNLECEGDLHWADVGPGAMITGCFNVSNKGDPGSQLAWKIDSYPSWGSWTFAPSSGKDLTPYQSPLQVNVEVVAPLETMTEFEGSIKIVNTENIDDFCTIEVSLATPVDQSSFFLPYLDKLTHRFPMLNWILSKNPLQTLYYFKENTLISTVIRGKNAENVKTYQANDKEAKVLAHDNEHINEEYFSSILVNKAPLSFNPGDVLFEYDVQTACGDNQLLGVEFDGQYFWITGAHHYPTHPRLYKLSRTGSLINIYDQALHCCRWGWRDLVFDGTYLYASFQDKIDQIDPATGQWTGFSIQGPEFPNRGLAYDPATDHFWTANFNSSIYEFNRDGVVINEYANSFFIYGLAWDSISADGPWLWVYDQSGTSDRCHIRQFDPGNGTYTGVEYMGVYHDPLNDGAGGACFIDDWEGLGAFVGLTQNSPDLIFGMEMYHEPKPDLTCKGKLEWSDVQPGSTIIGEFTVSNEGDNGTELDWEITDWPDWGTWTFIPENGKDLEPEDAPITVLVEVVVPDEKDQLFSGEITLINSNDLSDSCTISVSLSTSQNKNTYPYYLLKNLNKCFPFLKYFFSDSLVGLNTINWGDNK